MLKTILTVEQRSITKIVRDNTNWEDDNDDGEIFDNTLENAEDRESSREVLHILHNKDEVEEIFRSILINLRKSIEF